MAEWTAEWTHHDLRRLCAAGRSITKGPLNDTYAGTLGGRPVFVRHRVLDDPGYGQTFAGERYVSALLSGRVRVPEVLQVVADEQGRDRFAVFEFVDGRAPDWEAPEVLTALADRLLAIHAIPADGLGDVGGALSRTAVPRYLLDLIRRECELLPRHAGDPLIGAPDALAGAMACFEGERPCLCHGDVHRENWLVDQAGELWTLDWEAARFRVAAADFNQMRAGWLTAGQEEIVLSRYLERSGRDRAVFTRQIAILRLLWHIRTYNFQVLVRGRSPRRHRENLDAANVLLGEILRGTP
ncbi:aminoglycoside phosphotransferase family protein [Streptosporangium sp. NPDC051022]|uniref:aminoglycoside phosphotransferase family protein n=1 Tax=Streptosporangium sp. NPDC051022 TaxID=3155752 RepID=UPI0034400774